ncbi:LamG domain-containing protein [Micromonospora sp. CPCC 205539]
MSGPPRIRGRLAGLTVATLAAATGVVFVATSVPSPAQAAPACAPAKATERDAVATAAACRQPVAVEVSRSEYTQVVAQPDGRLQLESAVEPQRTRGADGTWVDVDLTLGKGGDGLLRPAASVADVAFSAGGATPLITLKRAGSTMTLSWPGRLPTPVVVNDSATYPGVLPDVDLVVRATHTGFTHVLVLKTPQAAANPAVREIALKSGGDAEIALLHDGSLRAAVGTTPIASAERAVMWDSSQPVRSVSPGQEAGLARSDALTAGDGARTAAVAVQVARGELRLVPDAKLLASATYPVYVDPAWSVAKSKWAYATSNGCSNTDYSVARVGYSPDGPCVGSRFRSFFEFPTTSGSVSLKGKHIESAYVQMSLYHSWSCTNTWTHMYLASGINATMRASFSSMGLKTWLDSAEGHANKGSGCSDSPQPDMTMNFTGSAVTKQMQTVATGSWNTITIGFCACNSDGGWETAQDRWKKFLPNKAKLVVDYDSRPGTPSNLQLAGVACPASGVMTTGTLTPTLSAIHPDADTTQALVGTYEWVEVPAGGVGTLTDTYPARLPPPPKVAAPANGRAVTAPVTAAKEKTYAFRVAAQDPGPYWQWSAWSSWCQFRVDTTVPPVTVTVLTAPSGPGKAGTFRIESSATDVTGFRYGWTGATTPIAASGTPKSATVTLTAPKYGRNILYVSAVDATLNEGWGSKEFIVGRASPAVARWGLESYPGRSQAQAVADSQPSLGGDTPLTPTNVSWTRDARLLGGESASFNGTSYLTAPAAALNTSNSFSVAAWVRLTEKSADHTVLTKDASGNASLYFQYQKSSDRWLAQMPSVTSGSSITWWNARSTTVPQVGAWTHLATAYDAVEHTLKLYVNGTLEATVTGVTGFNDAAWPVLIGRSGSTWWKGNLADVQIFDRVVVSGDFTGQLASDADSGGVDEPGMLNPVLVGEWGFEGAVGCWTQDLVDTCEAPDSTGFGRWLALRRGADVNVAGNRDNGLELDGLFYPEQTGSTEVTKEWARSAVKNGITPPDPEGNQYTVWQHTPVVRTDQSFTVSAWVRLDRTDVTQFVLAQEGSVNNGFYLYYLPANGGEWKFKILKDAVTQDGGPDPTIAVVPALNADTSWHHLVGVSDVGRRELRLYVDGDLYVAPNGTKPSAVPFSSTWQPWQANGPLRVGSGWGDFNPMFGRIDDVATYQGAMTEAQVLALYNAQVVKDPAP